MTSKVVTSGFLVTRVGTRWKYSSIHVFPRKGTGRIGVGVGERCVIDIGLPHRKMIGPISDIQFTWVTLSCEMSIAALKDEASWQTRGPGYLTICLLTYQIGHN